jgi:hypothetical protein
MNSIDGQINIQKYFYYIYVYLRALFFWSHITIRFIFIFYTFIEFPIISKIGQKGLHLSQEEDAQKVSQA